jgi:hypothetical protein
VVKLLLLVHFTFPVGLSILFVSPELVVLLIFE